MILARARRLATASVLAWALVTGLPLPPATAAAPGIDIATVQLAGAGAPEDRGDVFTSAGIDPLAPVGAGWSAHVELPNEGQMVGFTWAAGEAALQLRSLGPTGWSPWVDIEASGDESPDPGEGNGRLGAGPAWVGPGTTAIEVQVVSGSLTDLTLHSLAPTSGDPGFGAPVAGAAIPNPPMTPRAAWGAQDWAYGTPGCEAGPRTARPRLAVVHHTVNTNSYSPSEAYTLVRGIQAFHIQSEGYCDVAYNFIIDRFGQRFEARAGGATNGIVGGHARGFNTGTIGIAMLGDHSGAGITPTAYASLRDTLTWKFFIHGIDAQATIGFTSGCVSDGSYNCKWEAPTVLALPTIIVHGDVTFTGCPGLVRNLIPSLRAEVAQQVIRSGPFNPLPGWVPETNVGRVLTLDRWGGIHPAGSAAPVASNVAWPGFNIARGISGTTTAGYVADGFGGLHPYGSATPIQSPVYWYGWDIVRGLAMNGPTSGYVLDGWGGVHPFGGAGNTFGGPYWYGWDIARDVVALPNGAGGYVLDGFGGVHAFGYASPVTTTAYWSGWDIARAVTLRPDGPGGYVLDGFGGIHAFGGAPPMAATRYTPGNDHFRDIVAVPGGVYVVDTDGFVWASGAAAPVTPSLTWTGYDLGKALVVG